MESGFNMPKVAKEFILNNPRQNRVVVCEDLNFFWDESELKEMARMWNRGASVERISVHFDRNDPDEVLFALIHIAREDKIVRRKGGLF